MIVTLLYITVLHYLLYRQHVRQKRHETVTLAMAHLLQTIGQQVIPSKDFKDNGYN